MFNFIKFITIEALLRMLYTYVQTSTLLKQTTQQWVRHAVLCSFSALVVLSPVTILH